MWQSVKDIERASYRAFLRASPHSLPRIPCSGREASDQKQATCTSGRWRRLAKNGILFICLHITCVQLHAVVTLTTCFALLLASTNANHTITTTTLRP